LELGSNIHKMLSLRYGDNLFVQDKALLRVYISLRCQLSYARDVKIKSCQPRGKVDSLYKD